ncbi:MAG: hypothetical protein K2N36_07060 [Ruminiclostridium sp.]|nr:hypothetical protein [Ruminiclostridium sp.]
MKIDGDVIISRNYTDSNGYNENNLYLPGSKTISIGSDFSYESEIGVSTGATLPNICKDTAVTIGSCGTDVSVYFYSDVYGKSISYNKINSTIQLTGSHSYSNTWSKDETNHWHVCSVCGSTKDTAEHRWGNNPSMEKSPTCTTEGVWKYTCTCGATKTEPIPAWGHSYSDTYKTSLTQHWKVCNQCDTAGTKSNHTWESKTTTAATCTAAGTKTSACTVCGYIKTESIAATGHQTTQIAAKAATCGHDLKSGEAAHTWNDGEVTKEPTADESGEKTFTCTVCSKAKTEILPAVGGIEDPDPDNPDRGDVSIEVQPGEKELINKGVEIKIVLKVEDGTDSVSAKDKEKAEAALSGLSDYTLGQYLDVNLLKIIGDTQEEITETDVLITVTFEIPEALRSEGRTYLVIRVHDGEAVVLSDLDSNINTLTIKTDKFSTYALAYSEKTTETPPAKGSYNRSESKPPVESSPGVSESEPSLKAAPTAVSPNRLLRTAPTAVILYRVRADRWKAEIILRRSAEKHQAVRVCHPVKKLPPPMRAIPILMAVLPQVMTTAPFQTEV